MNELVILLELLNTKYKHRGGNMVIKYDELRSLLAEAIDIEYKKDERSDIDESFDPYWDDHKLP